MIILGNYICIGFLVVSMKKTVGVYALCKNEDYDQYR